MANDLNKSKDGTNEQEREYQIVKTWLSTAQPFDIVKAIAEAEGFQGTDSELFTLSSKKSASIANDLEHAIECLVEAINDKRSEERED
jgi:hypothetical protein